MAKLASGQDHSEPPTLRRALLAWYARHKRDLPWRQDLDPYRVWVSEIMLQQTRVAAVLEHYRLFMQAFPTVQALAQAPQDRVLALWSGLGYYRRARMLHQAAKLVVSELGGVIPRRVEELRKLPGVGRYTASAVASIAFAEPVAVVDGNVERVLTRLDGEPRAGEATWKRAQELLDRRHPGDWNQAMMELGATVCTPQSPACPLCPLLPWCHAPGAEATKAQPPRQRVQTTRALVERGHSVFLVQRPADAARMPGMWELPECDPLAGLPAPGRSPDPAPGQLFRLRHSITDTDYEVRVLRLVPKALRAKDKKAGRWVRRDQAFELPLTGLARKILRKLGIHGAAAGR
jgi:A/G-specific adenine glycosylase